MMFRFFFCFIWYLTCGDSSFLSSSSSSSSCFVNGEYNGFPLIPHYANENNGPLNGNNGNNDMNVDIINMAHVQSFFYARYLQPSDDEDRGLDMAFKWCDQSDLIFLSENLWYLDFISESIRSITFVAVTSELIDLVLGEFSYPNCRELYIGMAEFDLHPPSSLLGTIPGFMERHSLTHITLSGFRTLDFIDVWYESFPHGAENIFLEHLYHPVYTPSNDINIWENMCRYLGLNLGNLTHFSIKEHLNYCNLEYFSAITDSIAPHLHLLSSVTHLKIIQTPIYQSRVIPATLPPNLIFMSIPRHFSFIVSPQN